MPSRPAIAKALTVPVHRSSAGRSAPASRRRIRRSRSPLRGSECVRFELRVVCRRDDERSQLQETADDCPCQRRALLGIGSCAKFVEQHQIVRRHLASASRSLFECARRTSKDSAQCSARRRHRQRWPGKTDTTTASSAGTNSPVCAMSVNRPSVFNATVFPPVFGPVINKTRKSSPSSTSIGTTAADRAMGGGPGCSGAAVRG